MSHGSTLCLLPWSHTQTIGLRGDLCHMAVLSVSYRGLIPKPSDLQETYVTWQYSLSPTVVSYPNHRTCRRLMSHGSTLCLLPWSHTPTIGPAGDLCHMAVLSVSYRGLIPKPSDLEETYVTWQYSLSPTVVSYPNHRTYKRLMSHGSTLCLLPWSHTPTIG